MGAYGIFFFGPLKNRALFVWIGRGTDLAEQCAPEI